MTEKTYKIRDMLFTEKDRQKQVHFKWKDDAKVEKTKTFTIRALLPKDRETIGRVKSGRMNGQPTFTYSADDYLRIERSATIIVGTVEPYPEGWEGPDDAPEEAELTWLYNEIEMWSDAFQKGLKKNKLPTGSTES